MSLRINSQAPSFTAENTQGKTDFRQRVPEADAEGDLYGENGERMPYYPARPRQQGPYERGSQQIQIFKCPEALESTKLGLPYSSHSSPRSRLSMPGENRHS